MKTTDGSPRRRAIVSSSRAVLRTTPSRCSTRTRTSAMCVSPNLGLVGSDELVRGQELGKLGAALTLIGDDLALRTGRALGKGLDRGPGPGQSDAQSVN